jgi:hypothetical protein
MEKKGNYRHGMAYTSEHKTWCNIRSRCSDPKNNRYQHYGARGIEVCARWLESFENFLQDMGRKPGLDYSIERINVNGNYEPNNCIWLPRNKQSSNRTDSLRITLNGVTKTLPDWCREKQLKFSTVYMRIYEYGWNPELALTTPARRHKPYGTAKVN